MRFNLIIKICFAIFFCFQLNAQNERLLEANTTSKFKFLFDENRQYFLSMTLDYQRPLPSGSNFIGDAFEGKSGFGFNAHIYVFKNLFIGYSNSKNKFNNTAIETLGNFKRTSIYERYMTIGYEFLPLSKVRLGVYVSALGKATLSNDIDSLSDQKDTGDLSAYGLRLEYELAKNLSFTTSYHWYTIKTNIRVPSELKSYFNKGTYNVLSFGLKFNFGEHDLLQRLKSF